MLQNFDEIVIYNISTDKKQISHLSEFPRTDIHCHTYYSDGCMTLKYLVYKAKKSGFSTVIKADHNTFRGNDKLKNMCKDNGLKFISGIELSTNKGHMVVLNLESKEFLRGLSFEEKIEKIHEENGLAIMAHPWWGESMREEVFQYSQLDGFEALNHSSPFGSLHFLKHVYPKEKMEKINPHHLTPWAGSDSHGGYAYGKYYNIFKTMDDSVDGILEAMRKGNFVAFGPFLPVNLLLIDGAINQPVQLKKQLFYKKKT